MISGSFLPDERENPHSPDETKTALIKVRVAESVSEPMTNRLVLQGQSVAERKVTVRAETGGVISEVLVNRGETVKPGSGLIRLAVDDRKSRLREAKSLLEQRKTEYNGVQKLKKSGYQAETELAKAKAALDSASATVQMAKLELDRINITAPISGVVNDRLVEVGDFVKRGDPILIIVDLNPIRVIGQVSERYLGQIKVGDAGEVRLLNDTIVPAKVSYVGSIASNNTRTFPVEMQIPNPNGLIIEGVTLELHLPIKQVFAHKVPPSVLSLLDNGELTVKAVDSSNKVIAYPISLLGDSEDAIWLGGLPDKLMLVIVGHDFVQPGQRVIPVPNNPNITRAK